MQNRSYRGNNNPNFNNHKLAGKNHFNYIDGRTLKQNYCIDCKKELNNYRAKRCRVCYYKSKNKCSQKYFCKNCKKEISFDNGLYGLGRCHSCANKGKNHWNWQNGIGKKPYSLDWTKELKEQIRKRDNYTCQNCGITQIKNIKKINRVLDIHHIDYNKKNCRKDNLITLCLSCNIKVNKNRKYWIKYFKIIIKGE